MSLEGVKSQYSAKDIRESYDTAKAEEEKYTEWAAYYIYRPLSFHITPFFLHLGLTPSNVTFISLLLAISLPFVALWFPAPYLFVGIIGVIFSVFDCVDGNIARVTGQTSQKGGYFDFLADILHRVLLYLAIGIIISHTDWLSETYTGLATECLLIAALLAIVARMCRVYADSELQFSDESPVEDKNEQPTSSWLDKYFFPFFSGLDWALPIIVIIFGYFGLLHWVLIWLLLYSLLDFLYTQYSIFSKF